MTAFIYNCAVHFTRRHPYFGKSLLYFITSSEFRSAHWLFTADMSAIPEPRVHRRTKESNPDRYGATETLSQPNWTVVDDGIWALFLFVSMLWRPKNLSTSLPRLGIWRRIHKGFISLLIIFTLYVFIIIWIEYVELEGFFWVSRWKASTGVWIGALGLYFLPLLDLY